MALAVLIFSEGFGHAYFLVKLFQHSVSLLWSSVISTKINQKYINFDEKKEKSHSMLRGDSYKIEEAKWIYTYSSVPNRHAYTFINFEKKHSPARPYFGLHIYWFGEKIPPACLFYPGCVLVLVLHVYEFKLKIPPCTSFFVLHV